MAMRILASRWNDEPAARLAAVFARPGRLRHRRRILVFRAGGTRARAWLAARRFSARSPVTGRLARRIIACAWKNAARSRRAPLRMALEEAGAAPEAVGYLNYHGTSTELNDRIETRAVKLAFGKHAYRLPGIVAEEPDRPSAGGLRRGGSRGHVAGDARRRPAADRQRGCSRSGMRSRLRSGSGAAGRVRIRGRQLHRVREQEFGAGVEEKV